jgi:hypothetical protein
MDGVAFGSTGIAGLRPAPDRSEDGRENGNPALPYVLGVPGAAAVSPSQIAAQPLTAHTALCRKLPRLKKSIPPSRARALSRSRARALSRSRPTRSLEAFAWPAECEPGIA